MEISLLFIHSSLSLSLSLSLSVCLRYSPLSLWGQFIFSFFEYFKSFNRLTPMIYWVFIYRTTKKTFLNKNYWLIDTLKDNILKKRTKFPWTHITRIKFQWMRTSLGTGPKWLSWTCQLLWNKNRHIKMVWKLKWLKPLLCNSLSTLTNYPFRFFFRECTLIFMIERKRPGHSDNVGLSEEDSSSFDHQIRWVFIKHPLHPWIMLLENSSLIE